MSNGFSKGAVSAMLFGCPLLLMLLIFLGSAYDDCQALPRPRAERRMMERVSVEIGPRIAETDDDFICATLDWWPPEKCDYGTCSWGNASLLNLDLDNPILAKAVKAFSSLKIRLGGSLQDQVIYDVGKIKQPCLPFVRNASAMFGFSGGCLPMKRWDHLNAFFKETGVTVIFGLNALNGRHRISTGHAHGRWDSSNAQNFIHYTVHKGYNVKGWELGNELSGSGVGTRISAKQYAQDVIELNRVLNRIYNQPKEKPLVLAPGGFFDADWFKEFIQLSGEHVVNALTHHIYNLGPGVDKHLVDKILDPSFLNKESTDFKGLEELIQHYGPWSRAWVSEAGGAYNSGQNLVSNAFIYGFWYLDELAMSATYNTKVYCRQSLIGGNYGLLDTTTYVPNPDYYNALLWHRLMGTNVLSTKHEGSEYLRAYAHCSKNTKGITLLLLNYSKHTNISVVVNSSPSSSSEDASIITTGLEFRKADLMENVTTNTEEMNFRVEYHLTAKNENLHSRTMLLNGKVLDLTPEGEIPALYPVKSDATDKISLAPLSIAFVHLPFFKHPACSR